VRCHRQIRALSAAIHPLHGVTRGSRQMSTLRCAEMLDESDEDERALDGS
jgi:hypothetical protein